MNYFSTALSFGTAGLALILPTIASAIVIVSSPFSGSGGDLIERGFYVQNYAANSIASVELEYASFTAGSYVAALTARLGAYDGPVIGTATANFTLTGSTSSETAVTYDLGGALVPFGSTVTFSQTLISGPGSLYYDVGVGPYAGLFETEGTTPPLDTIRRNNVGVVITSASAVPDTSSGLQLFALGLGACGAYAFCLYRRKGISLL